MKASLLEVIGLIIMTAGVTLFCLFAGRHKEPEPQKDPPAVYVPRQPLG